MIGATHACILRTKWAHESDYTDRPIRLRFTDTHAWCEDGYRYDRHMNGVALMDNVRPGTYYRRLLLETLRPLVRNRLPRERVRL